MTHTVIIDEAQCKKALASVLSYAWIRQATTEDGRDGWALMDCDGELVLFSEVRSDPFYYAARHDLRVVALN
ncbi:hypothetical protein [Rhizobium lusitanum]|uniref:hypothetical protein n=1 Tax=Rhizobium lusitanum TaxID=293958 RepID=UPI00195B748A|nr:hypothetical protein [Rhizobium lusitanum]MBM7049713.1 hypothetical protein [Rhizobium lusitanum]